MKKLISIIIISLLISGCATFSSSMLRPPDNPLPTKLKVLDIGLEGENVYRDASIKATTVQSHFTTIFSRTIEQNICEQSRDKYGYIDLRIVHRDNNMRHLINLPIMVSYIFPGCFFPIALNAPVKANVEMEVEITIYDSKKALIKKYIIHELTKGWISSNYALTPASPTANPASFYNLSVELFHSILRKFEEQVAEDAEYINAELEKIGQIN